MKKVFVLVSLAITWTLSAHAALTPIPKEKLENYKNAVVVVMRNNPGYTCEVLSGSVAGGVDTMVLESTSGELDASGAQPILVFKSIQDKEKTEVRVTTSADYKAVLAMEVEKYAWGQVLKGDLRNPKVESGFVSTGRGLCKK